MGSTRFPGKILEELSGTPSIIYQINRIKPLIAQSHKLIVATTKESSDDVLCRLLDDFKINYFRGSTNNVLKRFLDCSEKYDEKEVVRINADCPLICPKLILKTIKAFEERPIVDYASTILDETYPLGMHVEVFRKAVLKEIYQMNLTDEQKEHVTPAIYRNEKRFNLFSVKNTSKQSHFRITVDYPEDLNVIRPICDHFGKRDFYCEDIVRFLETNHKIKNKNLHYMKSQTL